MSDQSSAAKKSSSNEEIIKFRSKWSKRMTTEGSKIVDAKSIIEIMPACKCDLNRVVPSPCHECVIYFLEFRANHAIKSCEHKLDVIDKANTAHIKQLHQQLAESDSAAVSQLRKSLAESEQLVERLRHLNNEKDEAYNNLNQMYHDRIEDGMNDERRINEMKAKLEDAQSSAKLFQSNALVLINHVRNVSGDDIPEDVKKSISVFGKTKLARSYHIDRMVSTTRYVQTESTQSSPNPGTQQIVEVIQNAFSSAVNDGDLMSQLARGMVGRGFLDEIKKLLLSPEISHEDICQFRRLFERDLSVKSRHYYTTRPNYDEKIKPRFFEVTKARRYERYGRHFVHFVQFKCNQTGVVFGTLVVDDEYLGSDELKAIATYKTPEVVKQYIEEQRLKKKREAEEEKKASKRRRESKQTDEDSSTGDA